MLFLCVSEVKIPINYRPSTSTCKLSKVALQSYYYILRIIVALISYHGPCARSSGGTLMTRSSDTIINSAAQVISVDTTGQNLQKCIRPDNVTCSLYNS